MIYCNCTITLIDSSLVIGHQWPDYLIAIIEIFSLLKCMLSVFFLLIHICTDQLADKLKDLHSPSTQEARLFDSVLQRNLAFSNWKQGFLTVDLDFLPSFQLKLMLFLTCSHCFALCVDLDLCGEGGSVD